MRGSAGSEREAVVDERTLMRDALKHSMGAARLPEMRAEFERRIAKRELIEVQRSGAGGPRVHNGRDAGLRTRDRRADARARATAKCWPMASTGSRSRRTIRI